MTTQGAQIDILAEMEIHCNRQLELCEKLEDIADSLPRNLDIQHCLHVAKTLYPAVKSAHDFEEEHVFPALNDLRQQDAALDASIERLRYEHWEDESYSQELSEVLLDWTKGEKSRGPEATGYMLRGFFEGLRRHIAFECEHIAPMLKKLPEEDPNTVH